MESEKISLYHYTSRTCAEAIQRSKTIVSSTGDRAHFGEGVYFTDMSPQDFTRLEVSRNNYWYPNAKRKLEYCIIVTMPRNRVIQCRAGRRRRVFLHEGDVNLEDEGYNYEIERCVFNDQGSSFKNCVVECRSHSKQGAVAANSIQDIHVAASSFELHVWLLNICIELDPF